MQVKVVSIAGDLLKIQTEGKIGQNERNPGEEPIRLLLGEDIYTQKVLLSLEKSNYIDSLGIAWLLQCHKRFQEAGGMLVIHSIPPMIMQTLKVMRLEKVLHLAADEVAARQEALGDTYDER